VCRLLLGKSGLVVKICFLFCFLVHVIDGASGVISHIVYITCSTVQYHASIV